MSGGRRGAAVVVLTAIAANACILVAKAIAWLASGSPSMLAETVHSLADVANQALLFVGVEQSRGGPSRSYPYGKGRARYLWNLISAVGIFFIGFGVTTYHGIHSLLTGADAGERGFALSFWVLVVSLAVEGVSFTVAWRDVRRAKAGRSWRRLLAEHDDPTALGVLFEDSAALIGLLLALAGILARRAFGVAGFDAAASILIGLLLGVSAVALAHLNGRLLLGRAAAPTEAAEIRGFLESRPEVRCVKELATVVIGPDRLRLSAEIELDPAMFWDRRALEEDAAAIRAGEEPLPVLVRSADRMVRLVGRCLNELERALQQRFPEITAVDLEVE